MPITNYRNLAPKYDSILNADPQSRGMARPADVKTGGSLADAFGAIGYAATKGATYDPTGDPAYYLAQERAQKLKEAADTAAMNTDIADTLDPSKHPEWSSTQRRQAAVLRAVRGGGKQESLADAFLNLDAQDSGASNDTLGRDSLLRHGSYGKDASFTQPRQDQIRTEDETSKQNDRAAQEAAAADRNRFSQTQENARNTATIKAGDARSAATIAAENARAAAALAGKDTVDVGVRSLGDWDNEIDSQLGIVKDKQGAQVSGPKISPDVRTAIRSKAIDNFSAKKGSNPSAAVAQAIGDSSTPSGNTRGDLMTALMGSDAGSSIVKKAAPDFEMGTAPVTTGGLADLFMPKAAPPPAVADGASGGGPAVGAVVGGFKFKGGDPNDKANWEKQ